MVVVLRPLYDFFMQRTWVKRPGVATLLTIVSFLLIVAIPLILLINITVAQAKDIMGGVSLEGFNLEDALVEVVEWLRQVPGIQEAGFNPDDIQARLQESYDQTVAEVRARFSEVVNWLAGLAIGLGTSLPNMLINLFLFLGFLITVLPSFDRIVERLETLLPLENPITQTYTRKVTLMVRSMFLGIFVLSIIQGLAMGVFYVLAGVPYAGFWTVLSIGLSVIPMVGISFIALPMGIILILSGNVWQGILILVGFYGFVNWMDNLLRPKLVPKEAYLNPMLLILSVFGGLALSGLMGVIYGPVIMILFVTTIEMYVAYYQDTQPTGSPGPGIAVSSTPGFSSSE
jgi:predicted PurR-regulated permease PerM